MKNSTMISAACRPLAAMAILLLSACGDTPDEPPPSDSWVRIDAHGNEVQGDGASGHQCVLDNRTGLMWEVKHDAPGNLHHFAHTYSWHSSDEQRHMSEPGPVDGGQCEGSACDTQGLIEAVNAAELCGFGDWTLPDRDELMSLGDASLRESGMIVEMEFFPHTVAGEYWTLETFRLYPQSAWAVDMSNGLDRADLKSEAKAVRLVRHHRVTEGD